MTKEEIIRMAREAWLVRTGDGWTVPHRWGMAEIERFANLVSAHKAEVALAEAYRCGYEAGVEAAASKAYGVGDEGMYAQIMELKK